MINKLAKLSLALGLVLSSCAYPIGERWPKKREYYPPEIVPEWKYKEAFKNHRFGHFYHMCDYYSYPARIGDSTYNLFLGEGGDSTDVKEFMEFQRGIERETNKAGNGNFLEWRDSTLTIVEDGHIMIPDANGNGLPGE